MADANGQSPDNRQKGKDMADQFTYDVFLSHSVKDKPIVRELAEQLRNDGLPIQHQLKR